MRASPRPNPPALPSIPSPHRLPGCALITPSPRPLCPAVLSYPRGTLCRPVAQEWAVLPTLRARYWEWWRRGKIQEWPREGLELCAFYNLPLSAGSPLAGYWLSHPAVLPVQFAAFRAFRALCLHAVGTFNIQDAWSSEEHTYSQQMHHVTSFLEREYSEVPWFERAVPPEAETPALAPEADPPTPRCLDEGAPPFAVLRDAVASTHLADLRRELDRLATAAHYTAAHDADPSSVGHAAGWAEQPWHYFERENSSTLNRIERFVPHSAVFASLAETLLQCACGRSSGVAYALLNDKINLKHAGAAAFHPHQDISAGWGKYASRHVTIGLALGDLDVGSGCIWVADSPGERLTPDSVDLTPSDLPDEAWRPVPMRAGDAVVFDSFVPHRSYVNRADGPRPVVYFTYTHAPSRFDQYYADKLAVLPPDRLKVPGRWELQ